METRGSKEKKETLSATSLCQSLQASRQVLPCLSSDFSVSSSSMSHHFPQGPTPTPPPPHVTRQL